MILLKCVLVLYLDTGEKKVYNMQGMAHAWSEPTVRVDFYDEIKKQGIKTIKTVHSVNSNNCLFITED